MRRAEQTGAAAAQRGGRARRREAGTRADKREGRGRICRWEAEAPNILGTADSEEKPMESEFGDRKL
jgi:hypothetical protein